MAAKTVGFVASAVLPLVLVRRLSLLDYGSYKQLFLLLNSAVLMLPLGMQMSAYYFVPRAATRGEKGHIVFLIVLFHLFVGSAAAVVLVARPDLLGNLFQNAGLARYGRLIGVAVALWISSGLLETLTIANGETRLSSRVIVVSNLSRSIFLLVAAVVWKSLLAILIAAIFYASLQTIYLFIYINLRFPEYWRGLQWRSLRTLLAYSVPMGVAGLLWYMETDIHNYFVSRQFGPQAFAIYSAGTFQLPLIGILSDSIGSVMIPRVALFEREGRRDEILAMTADTMRILALPFFAAFAYLFVMAPEFVTFLFTSRYVASVPVFRVNLFMVPLTVIMVDPIMRAHANQKFFLLCMHGGVLIALVLIFWFGLPGIGLTGAMACVVGSQYTTRAIEAGRVAKLLRVRWAEMGQFRDVMKIAMAAAAAAIAALALKAALRPSKPFVPLLACGLLFLAVYVAALAGLKILRERDLAWLRRRFPIFRGHLRQ